MAEEMSWQAHLGPANMAACGLKTMQHLCEVFGVGVGDCDKLWLRVTHTFSANLGVTSLDELTHGLLMRFGLQPQNLMNI